MEKYTNIELKSMAYDCLATIEQNQNNLKIINKELFSRTEKTPDNNTIEEVKVEEEVVSK